MPHSLRDNDELVVAFAQNHGITTVLDIGAGSGTYAHLLRPLGCTMDAVEIWQPYLDEYSLSSLYRDVFVEDVRTMAHSSDWNHSYDLIIFGDVLEHMTKAEALSVWAWAHRVARWGLISVPIVHWPQGAEHGNPHEAHVQEHIDAADLIKEFGPFDVQQLYPQTATFIKEF
jgi:predicted TPR repeat methyltransferase